MDNLDDSEKHAKISDSAYSNSCSNSQSRRSRSSKSTHSGSNSSGSSGYGGKQSTSGSSSKIASTSKKSVEEEKGKRKKAFEKPALLECRPPEPIPLPEVTNTTKEKLDGLDVAPPISMHEEAVDNIIIPIDQGSTKDENPDTQTPVTEVETHSSYELEGFSCAISMQDGVVMYTTQNLYANLGFPKDMWIGRSFIDFVHPRDRNTLASQITNSLALPKIVHGAPKQQQETNQPTDLQECTMACRIRRYKALNVGFMVKDRVVSYVPFVLKFSFKEIKDDAGSVVYLIIKATPLFPAYKTPNELLLNPVPFVIRHSATGVLEYIDIESVPYLGYLPQDVRNQDALMMYHPDDLPVLKMVYETIVKEGGLAKSIPYRMMTQNGDYVKLETEWTSFINPWSTKLEFVIGKHYVLEGPTTPDVFKAPPPPPDKPATTTDEDKLKIDAVNLHKENILKILKDVLTKPAETAKQQITKRVQDLAMIMETLLEEPKATEELRIDTQEGDIERDSVMLGGISPHHEYKDSMSSTGTPLSYNQLNYNENLQRYFDSHQKYRLEASNSPLFDADDTANVLNDHKMLSEASAKSHMSPLAQNSIDSLDISPTSSLKCSTPPAPSEFLPARLTESLLIKHNCDMEKELAKSHREGRSTNKIDRTSDNRQKKKEHLARCNATFHPTKAGAVEGTVSPHTLKRPSKNTTENDIPAKQSCPSKTTNNPAMPQPSTTNAVVPWTYPQPVYGTPYMFPPMPVSMQQQQMMAQLNQAPRASSVNQREEGAPSTKNTKPQAELQPPKPVVEKEVEKPTGPSDEDMYSRTDGESSYSSFYSSFLKTDSGSISSNDPKRPRLELTKKEVRPGYTYDRSMGAKKTPRRKMDPPWMDQVSLTPDLLYKYQVPMKSKDETMKEHMEKMKQLGQSSLVNEQLGQLYLDLQLEGVASRLTLEEGITSSSSSGEESLPKAKGIRRKRMYSKLNMIYEENAPLPSPSTSEAFMGPSPAPSEAPIGPSESESSICAADGCTC